MSRPDGQARFLSAFAVLALALLVAAALATAGCGGGSGDSGGATADQGTTGRESGQASDRAATAGPSGDRERGEEGREGGERRGRGDDGQGRDGGSSGGGRRWGGGEDMHDDGGDGGEHRGRPDRGRSGPRPAPVGVPDATGSGAPMRKLATFVVPGGNIGCRLTAGSARCDIRNRRFRVPPQPTSCKLDWGGAFGFAGGQRAGILCVGDTAIDPGAARLAAGHASRVGKVVCQSVEGGVSCADVKSGHGFFLTDKRFRLY